MDSTPNTFAMPPPGVSTDLDIFAQPSHTPIARRVARVALQVARVGVAIAETALGGIASLASAAIIWEMPMGFEHLTYDLNLIERLWQVREPTGLSHPASMKAIYDSDVTIRGGHETTGMRVEDPSREVDSPPRLAGTYSLGNSYQTKPVMMTSPTIELPRPNPTGVVEISTGRVCSFAYDFGDISIANVDMTSLPPMPRGTQTASPTPMPRDTYTESPTPVPRCTFLDQAPITPAWSGLTVSVRPSSKIRKPFKTLPFSFILGINTGPLFPTPPRHPEVHVCSNTGPLFLSPPHCPNTGPLFPSPLQHPNTGPLHQQKNWFAL